MVHNAGLFDVNSMIMGLAFAYGGGMQMIAGAMEWRRGNTFGTTAFLSYGAFWVSFGLMTLLPGTGMIGAASNMALATYMFAWGLFTGMMFIGALRAPIALQVVFALLTIVFMMLAVNYAIGVEVIFTRIISVFGLALALSALYTGMGEVINEMHGREILPLGIRKG